jgi:hypothetical protein
MVFACKDLPLHNQMSTCEQQFLSQFVIFIRADEDKINKIAEKIPNIYLHKTDTQDMLLR